MGRNSFRLVPKLLNANTIGIWIVTSNDSMQIAQVLFPNDGQMNDNLEAAEGICDVLKKRIRKSV